MCSVNFAGEPLAIGLAPDILPVVLLFHVLFAVGFPFGFVSTRWEEAREGSWGGGVLVIDTALQFFRRWPAVIMVLAGWDSALERATV